MHMLDEGIIKNNTSIHSTEHVQKRLISLPTRTHVTLIDGPKSPKPQTKLISAKLGGIEKSKRHADGNPKFLCRWVFLIK